MVKAVSSSPSLIPSTWPVPSHRLTTLFKIVIAAGLALTVGAAFFYFYRGKKVQPVAPTSLEIAKECFARGDYKNALAHCKDAHIGDPREVLLLEAQAHFALRQNNDAMRVCQSLAFQSLHDKPLLAAETFLLLGNIWQREPNGLDHALQQYNTAWGCLFPNDPNVPARLKVEILIGKSLAILKAKKESDYETASSSLASAVGIAEEHNRTQSNKDLQLVAKAYYYQAYYYLLADLPNNARLCCTNGLTPLQYPSNDQELNLKAQLLLLKSLIHEKKGDRKDATAAVQEGFNLDPSPTLLGPQLKENEIEIADKEIVAAAYFLKARYTESAEDKIVSFSKALENVENDDPLKALIQCERGQAYLHKARSDKDPATYQKAREDFNILSINTYLYNPARSDLWQAIIEVGKLNNLPRRIQEGLAALSEQSSSAV